MKTILNRFTGNVILEYTGNLKTMALQGLDLQSAALAETDLREINLQGSILKKADLKKADLGGANLQQANLWGANLEKANLEGAKLRGTDLGVTNLEGANLHNTVLEETIIQGAVLKAAKIPNQWIEVCKADTFEILKQLHGDAAFLKRALVEGKVDGSTYRGKHACLVGTLANASREDLRDFCRKRKYDSSLYRYGEQWFYQIRLGDTPQNNLFARHALVWCEEILKA